MMADAKRLPAGGRMGARSGRGSGQDNGDGARESNDGQDPQAHESSPFSRTGCLQMLTGGHTLR
jgi:hypothetical protein